VVAHVLECPVFFVSALFTAPARYDVYCEPLFERVELPRGQRAEALRQTAQRYAEHLEAKTRLAPLNWFNFYPFWEDS
jgi:predicted LPLAT superfamily acyltransferase